MIVTPLCILTWVALQSAPVISEEPDPDPTFIAANGAHTDPIHFDVLLPDEPFAMFQATVGSIFPEPVPCVSENILAVLPPLIVVALTLFRSTSP